MSSTSLLIINNIGPAFTSKTESLGGSEHELVQIAHAFAKKGRSVVFANAANIGDETMDGVRYVSTPRMGDITHADAVILARITPMPSGLTWDRAIVRATDNFHEGYLTNKELLKDPRATLALVSAWQEQQAGFQTFAQRRVVIHPMVEPCLPRQKTPMQYVFASGPMKGLDATLQHWELLYDKFLPEKTKPSLVIAAPGHYVRHYAEQFPVLSPRQREHYNIHYAFSDGPHPRIISADEYRQAIAESEGLFYVNTMPETFGVFASLAERTHCRPHILAWNGAGGLVEALDDKGHVYDLAALGLVMGGYFLRDVAQCLGVPYTPPSVQKDRSPEAMLPAWEELLFPNAIARGKHISDEIAAMDDVDFPGYSGGYHDAAVKRAGELFETFRTNLARLPLPENVSPHWKLRSDALAGAARDRKEQGFLRWTGDLDSDGNGASFRSWYIALRQDEQWPRWKRLMLAAPWGNPHKFPGDDNTSPTCVQHAYHLFKYEQACGPFLKNIDIVFEVGGGHGNFARMLREDGFRGSHVILDLPHVREFQRLFLSLCEIPIADGAGLLMDTVGGVSLIVEEQLPEMLRLLDALNHNGFKIAFVSTFGLSETPHSLRKKLWPLLMKADKHLIAVLGWPEWHGVDNAGFFMDLFAQSGPAMWAPVQPIEGFADHLKASTRYMFGKRAQVDTTYESDAPPPMNVPATSQAVVDAVEREYRLHELPDHPSPTVLDIGAHVGAFSLYALRRWPGAMVHAYEPHPETFKLLTQNTPGGILTARRQAAVVHPKTSETVRLFEGVNGSHECSIRDDVRWPHVSQKLDTWVDVPAIDASDLPRCDVLKIDTEGSEIPILAGYRYLTGVSALLVETHAVGGDLAGQQRQVRAIAQAAGLTVELEQVGTVLRFYRKTVAKGAWTVPSPSAGSGPSTSSGPSAEQLFPEDPALAVNKTPSSPFFGRFIELLRGAISPGGSEFGAGLTLFALAASTRSKQIVEIGRFKGFTTLALAAALALQDENWVECSMAKQRPDVDYAKHENGPKALVSIDPHPTREADELLERADLARYVVKINKRSDETDLKGPIDLLFIDGSHAREDIQADIQRFVPWVKPGGYFVLHDFYGWFRQGPSGVENGSPVAQVIREDLQGFEQLLVDTGYASFVVFRKNRDLDPRPTRVPARKDGRPTVGLCIIAKGAEVGTVVARAIGSIKHQVDAVTVVCDASPETARIAELMGADVFIRATPKTDWERGIGFIAGARNEALAIAERRTDYVLLVDPDDYYEGSIPSTLDKDVYEIMIRDGNTEYPRPLMFRSQRGFQFTGIRHESLTYQGSFERMTTLRYVRGHSAYGHQDQDQPAVKFAKHAKDLEKWLMDHPEDSRAMFYLAQSYRDAGQPERALVCYERRASMPDFPEEAWFAQLRVGELLIGLQKDPTAALLKANSMQPQRAEALLTLARWYGTQGNAEAAYLFAKQAASLNQPHITLFFNAAVYQYEALTAFAEFALKSGRAAEAVEAITVLIDRVPADKKQAVAQLLEIARKA